MPTLKYSLLNITLLFGLGLTILLNAQQTNVRNEGLKQSALAQMEAGRYGEAIDLLNKYISANPRIAEGYNLRGICFERRGQYQPAVLDFRRAIRLDTDYTEAKSNLARTQEVWYAQLRKKILGHEREIAINPAYPFNYLEIGKSYRWMEEWALAEEWYDKYLERDQNASSDEIIRYSEILAKNKKIAKGERILKQWVDKYPDDWRLWSRYGYFTMWLGKYRNAENAFKTALKFKPFFKEAQDGLDQATRQAYVTQQDPRAFEKEFPIDRYYRLLRRDPSDIDTRFKLVDELIKAERIEEAYNQLLTLSIENSDDERFQERYDYVTNFRDEVYRKRIETYLARFQANNRDKVAAQRLAEYYQYLQEYDSANEILQTYFNEVPDEKDKRLRFQFAKVVAWDRDFDYAIELTDELLEEDPDNLDYQLFRAQLSIWNNREIELVAPYLDNVLKERPDNLEAIIAMGSYMLIEQEFDSAQVYADKAAEIDRLNNDVITLQTNIDFQKLRAEEEARYAILEEGRQFVLDGDCESALPYYEQYLDEAEPNSLILKEYGDVLFCAKRYDEALFIYDDVLNEGYFYEAALQRGLLLYTKGDSVGALIAFKELNNREPGEFEPYLYMGDSYAKLGVFDSANAVYDSLLLREDIDSVQIAMIEQRQGWIPPTGLSGILKRFPSSVGLAPSLTFYSDNLSFRYTRLGARLDVGVTSFLALGVSFFKTYMSADRNSLDSATVFLVDSLSNFQNDFNRSYTSFKGHIFLKFSDRFRIGVGSGSLNDDGVQRDIETDVFATYEIPDTLNITATYLNSDAAIVLYSPYLIDLTIDDNRLFASLYKIQGKYTHKKQWQLSGSFQYVTVSDNNEGNDLMLRAGKYFENDMIAGYEYFYSNFKFVDNAAPFYYSPEGFESHSLWADFIIEKNKTADISIGGLIGYVPENDFLRLEGHLNAFYQFSNNFQIQGSLSTGSTSRENSSYRYFSGGLSAYWSF